MNKKDYLRKKGRLPSQDLGTLFVFKSTPDGVGEITEHVVWDEIEGGYNSNNGSTRYKILRLKEPPFECTLVDGQDVGEESGHGSGFGDLWSWSYFFSINKESLEAKRAQENKRVYEKYQFKKNNSREIFVELCRAILRIKGSETNSSLNFYSSYKGSSKLLKYEDDVIIIVGGESDLSLSITRKENRNPVVYVQADGDVFRSHGEQSHLFQHAKDIISTF
jgi:hypothetical protein